MQSKELLGKRSTESFQRTAVLLAAVRLSENSLLSASKKIMRVLKKRNTQGQWKGVSAAVIIMFNQNNCSSLTLGIIVLTYLSCWLYSWKHIEWNEKKTFYLENPKYDKNLHLRAFKLPIGGEPGFRFWSKIIKLPLFHRSRVEKPWVLWFDLSRHSKYC